MGLWGISRRSLAIGTLIVAGLAACSGGGGGSNGTETCGTAPTPTIEPTTAVTQLTPTQAGELCDWTACIFGGYGAHYACSGGLSVNAEPNQSSCVSSITGVTCTATVADVTGCFDSIAGDPCALITSSACTVFFECATPQ